jgi:hypothetical protein
MNPGLVHIDKPVRGFLDSGHVFNEPGSVASAADKASEDEVHRRHGIGGFVASAAKYVSAMLTVGTWIGRVSV